jgi:rhodanese-related sulfurtransferase
MQNRISIIVLLSLVMGTLTSSCQQKDYSKLVSADSLNTILKSGNRILLDVRTPGEFVEGYIPGSINIDYLGKDFSPSLDKLDKNKQYVVYCLSGGRSALTAEIMKEKGFKKVLDLDGGIISWKEKGYKITK